MPGFLILLAAGALLWAYATGRLKNFTYEDGAAAILFLLGLRFLTTGKLLIGAGLMAGALLWGAHRRRQLSRSATMPVEDARRLLGVAENATLEEIRTAHRRLIARVHPDTGGSAELAERVNVARDTLVAEMNRRTPRAS
ncbi:J domain-containing protein [Allosphingosinicella deserti]|uniref:Molecular chaperone DnaJ n=1 Tax=Allosphingosinicella deserti TaxID=2116704 RepID=A0A2P7QV32_9SPHN|nr:DnaJ domain-containing protein [Sphingomonas deserti]PSJ41814.1 molecular chaperone DnaJ [Sphingomonas deserti]